LHLLQTGFPDRQLDRRLELRRRGSIAITGGIDFPDATTDIAGGSTQLVGGFNSATLVDLGEGGCSQPPFPLPTITAKR
jgi:hypothetical protein